VSGSNGELVYVVARARLMPDGAGWRGVRQGWLEEELRLLRTGGELRPRAAMETDPTFKQVIPYLVLRDGPRYFLMRRTRAGADERLHERWSIGIGGHLNGEDLDLEDGLRREWREEIDADFDPAFRFVGLLNDDESDVGRVHVGLVYVAQTGGRSVAVREVDKLAGEMVERDQVAAVRERMESWSALVFDFLERENGR
jgi:predicted NUDIX family phosphoesterase